MNAVITYIFGNKQELLRDPLVIEPGIEYLCITDNPTLTSKTWKIIRDSIPEATCARDKMVYVKYNPFKYTNAQYICVIDGSMEISHMLAPFFARLRYADLLLKKHPQRCTLDEELYTWKTRRNLPENTVNKFIAMSMEDNISLTNKFLIESCIIGYNVNKKVRLLCRMVLKYMKWLGENDRLCVTNQCVLTYLLQKHKLDIDYIQQKKYFTRYSHNTWKVNKL